MVPAIFGLSGLTLGQDERAFFKDADPAGYILFGRNVESREQMRALTDELRAIHGRDNLFICIDQEGGRVARMKPPVWPAYPPGEAFDRLYDIAPATAIEAARANAEALGLDLAEVGITVDCHPSLDVRQTGAHDVIGDRALGTDPMRVAALGRAILAGLARAGVAGCIKHIPGHGRAMADSHKELPRVDASAEDLETDLQPFRALSDSPIGMTAHVLYTAWDKENPGTLSPVVVREVIRKSVGFAGLLLTDDLDMEALSGTVPERAERAIAAGCDIALNCWAKMDDMVGIAERLPSMSEETALRLKRALTAVGDSGTAGDQAELIARRDALLAQVAA
ncbi:beta-N-acetylhexosaminidase [Novosphingobium pentaromativorans]|uniref:beta-N-acetylhexosaminidase n=1 Tax=Novosphingobium pentaromativorans US6-1 TaxID=1088721 RepID=G6ECW9_9SPHN|nr:beta-N-acetylhexosaminidase [Novosphingobium pentaromativorans]AIT79926.1 beta-hexosaminidase [Novosphingobium pentaromativorans US6-1]EHJ60808.1 beta-N-acetylhexosaminidase [Novosphingobium pentaromativorans US6-1]